MTRKNTKFTLGIKIASILTCLAMTAIGFAAWLIVNPATATFDDGSFTVYTVSQNKVDIAVTGEGTTIVFGTPELDEDDKLPTTSNHWLLAHGTMAEEALVATFTATITSDDPATTDDEGEPNNDGLNLSEIVDQITVSFAGDALLAAAIEDGYIAEPTIQVGTADAVTATAGVASTTVAPNAAKTQTLNITVTFDWGTAFGGENPYTYYNNQAYTEDLATAAQAALNAVNALKDAGYSLTINTTNK